MTEQKSIFGDEKLYLKIENYLKDKGIKANVENEMGAVYGFDGGTVLFIKNGWKVTFGSINLEKHKDLTKMIGRELK